MPSEQRLSNLESWKEQFINVTDTLMLDSNTKQDTLDLLIKEVFQLKATVQVLSDELASLKRRP